MPSPSKFSVSYVVYFEALAHDCLAAVMAPPRPHAICPCTLSVFGRQNEINPVDRSMVIVATPSDLGGHVWD